MHLSNWPSWRENQRGLAAKKALEVGWPTKKDEPWRYTNLTSMQKVAWREVAGSQEAFVVPSEVAELVAGADQALFFYNGQFLSKVSKASLSEDNLSVSLARAMMSAGRIGEVLGAVLQREPNPNLKNLGYMNQAGFKDGAVVQLRDANVRPKIAIVYLYGNEIGVSAQAPTSIYPRTVIRIGEGVNAEVSELHFAVNDIPMFISSALDAQIEARADLQLTQVFWMGDEAYFVSDTQVDISKAARVDSLHMPIGGRILHDELKVRLREEGAETNCYAIYRGTKKSHTDLSTNILHEKGHTRSDQVYKGVMYGASRAVFNGRLEIFEDAQKSDARQLNQSLLMSEEAEVDSKPQLLVAADDVKAAHGATIGKLQDEQIFYLVSRGIPRAEAEQMLAGGFEGDIINRLRDGWSKSLMRTLAERARQGRGI